VGVPDERARAHNEEFFEITEEVHQPNSVLKPAAAPPGATLH